MEGAAQIEGQFQRCCRLGRSYGIQAVVARLTLRGALQREGKWSVLCTPTIESLPRCMSESPRLLEALHLIRQRRDRDRFHATSGEVYRYCLNYHVSALCYLAKASRRLSPCLPLGGHV